ncbi:exodeoxyribonuclease V subunit gamma [Aquihabitans sp. G128]|uniref:exodeoxyribonuclease V subunit gamma n=1 Tax=Aquihabitans sp. G128 TaxID=2849779 RepID=UPI001C248C4B|nr:exodeoxyribonuclease V subunit gamma [Aquihabitans sp. G128]QXC63298.1 exodeoxyribonuclease V subunit gamma [Aquihabitans sp. G128]
MLRLHTADRVVPLAARLAEVLAEAPSDAFAPEWIAVPSEGMRRWLALELARHLGASGPGSGDGVAANIETAFPGSLRTRAGRRPPGRLGRPLGGRAPGLGGPRGARRLAG